MDKRPFKNYVKFTFATCGNTTSLAPLSLMDTRVPVLNPMSICVELVVADYVLMLTSLDATKYLSPKTGFWQMMKTKLASSGYWEKNLNKTDKL